MCGRFALGVPVSTTYRNLARNLIKAQRPEIYQAVRVEHVELNLDGWVGEDAFYPRFNIAPRSMSPVIRRCNRYDDAPTEVEAVAGGEDASDAREKGQGAKTKAVMHTMKWGLVPHWSKHEDTSLNTINAKGENLTDGGGGMWNSIKGKKRCAVVCQGYYEWLKKGKERLPHFTKHSSGRLMLLAGLYDSVILEGTTERLYTFTIVTTDASKQLDWLHDRMPVVLPSASALSAWLDTSAQTWDAKTAALIRPYPLSVTGSGKGTVTEFGPLECYAVPTDVGKVGAESAAFVEPVQKRRDGIEAMFARAKQAGKASDGTGGGEGRAKLKAEFKSPGKRKRSASREGSVELLESPPPGANAKKSRKTNDDKVTTTESKQARDLKAKTASKTAKKLPSPEPPNKRILRDEEPGRDTGKITSFFIKNSE